MNKKYFALLAIFAAGTVARAQEEPQTPPVTENASETVPAETAVPAAEAVPAKPALTPEEEAAKAEAERLERERLAARLMRSRADLRQTQLALARQISAFSTLSLDFQTEELAVNQRLHEMRVKAELAETTAETARLKSQLALATAQKNLQDYEAGRETALRELNARVVNARNELEMSKMQLEVMRSSTDSLSRTVASALPQRVDEPFDEATGTLKISDRRIDFNGPVTMDLAKYVCDRLAFFDNQDSSKPIFIVIDSSPGGSVFAGYLILKSMESCRAPVHVLVKSYAASMAAVITTLAPNSYCLEETIILHHQPSSGIEGNLTVMAQGLESLKVWTGNIFNRVCEKVGVSYDEFVADMYKNFKSGDWLVFGKEAVERKWTDRLVKRVVETGVPVKPEVAEVPLTPALYRELPQQRDANGRVYVQLPALEAGDAWWMSDSRGIYRPAK